MLVNDKLERMEKEVPMGLIFKVLSEYLPARTESNHKKLVMIASQLRVKSGTNQEQFQKHHSLSPLVLFQGFVCPHRNKYTVWWVHILCEGCIPEDLA
jgi:hypothetical protein